MEQHTGEPLQEHDVKVFLERNKVAKLPQFQVEDHLIQSEMSYRI